MIPAPVIALISVVGFVVYLCIGAACGPLIASLIQTRESRQALRNYSQGRYEELEGGWLFGFSVLFWPFMLPGMAIWRLVQHPFRLFKGIGTYTAGALLKGDQ